MIKYDKIRKAHKVSKQSCLLSWLQTIQQTVNQAISCSKLPLKVHENYVFTFETCMTSDIKIWVQGFLTECEIFLSYARQAFQVKSFAVTTNGSSSASGSCHQGSPIYFIYQFSLLQIRRVEDGRGWEGVWASLDWTEGQGEGRSQLSGETTCFVKGRTKEDKEVFM